MQEKYAVPILFMGILRNNWKTGKLIDFSGPLMLGFTTGAVVTTFFYSLNHSFTCLTITVFLGFKALETSIEYNILEMSYYILYACGFFQHFC